MKGVDNVIFARRRRTLGGLLGWRLSEHGERREQEQGEERKQAMRLEMKECARAVSYR